MQSNSYIDIETLCLQAVDRNFRGDPNSIGSVISHTTYMDVWNAFTQWCHGQIDFGRAISMNGFGIIGYQQVQNSRVLYIKLGQKFMQTHGLTYTDQMLVFQGESRDLVMEPLNKPHYKSVSTICGVEHGICMSVIQNLTHCIGQILSESHIVEIDLKDMGRIFSNNKQVIYDPFSTSKQLAPQGKQTVKKLMDYGAYSNLPPNQNQNDSTTAFQTGNSQSRPQTGASAYGSMPKISNQGRPQTGASAYGSMPNISNQGYNTTMGFYSQPQLPQSQKLVNDPSVGNMTYLGQTPARRFKKPLGDGKITKDLLGAGDDPMRKTQEFSLLASNPSALMRQTFTRPESAVSRYPPVIDAFSRTLAAPISNEKEYFPISHKIGTNFSPATKGLYIDIEHRAIRFKQMGQGQHKLNIVGDASVNKYADVVPADEQEEYEALIYPQNADERRIKARKVSYARYRQYVENEISVDVIAPIRQYWLTHIIELIPGDLHAVEKERIEYLIDTMLNEINKDYFDSVRKSILDYILKNEKEMKRIGIQQVLNQPIQWGDDYYKGIEPNEEWKHNVMMARMLMSENLSICTQSTLELKKLWLDYNHYLFVDLPEPRSDPLSLNEFLSAQENQMAKVKNLLQSEWNKAATEILREELDNLDKDQTKTFFESTATLMSNQVRELIEQSVDTYVEFIQRYKFKTYPTPQEIALREYDADTPFEDNFIQLKLTIVERQEIRRIDFESIRQDEQSILDSVQNELEGIVDSIVKRSQNLPRAETTIVKSERIHLWDVKIDDEIVLKAKDKISETIKDNLETIKLSSQIYSQYEFILSEKGRIEKFLESENLVREELQAEIDKYEETIYKIREEMPYEIRMNMFHIKCSDINNLLVEELEQLIGLILTRVEQLIYQEMAPEITKNVKQIQDDMAVKAQNSKLLVQFEEKLEWVKDKEQHRLMSMFKDMIEWVMMLQNNPRQKQGEDTPQPIEKAYRQVDNIIIIIETSEQKLKEERVEIENGLMEQIREFNKQIEETSVAVKAFKEHSIPRKTEEYRCTIREIKETLQKLTKELQHINEQEVDLDLPQGEYPQIDELKQNIKPYEELWNLYAEYREKYEDAWQKGLLKLLDPDEVEGDHKRMMSSANRLTNRFENLKVQKPAKLAAEVAKQLMGFRKMLPIIRALCNPGLQPRHIELIAKLIGCGEEGKDIGNQKLDYFRNFKIETHQTELEEISETASKEFGNMKIMEKMEKDWEPLEFTCKEVPDKESYILDGEAVEAIQTILDDHIIKTQTMKGSPFAKFMFEKTCKWEDMIMRTQDNLDKWLKVQSTWMYLQPVFSSEDIISQMPVEGRKFKDVNIAWCDLMKRINSNPHAMTVNNMDDLGQILKDADDKLETVQKGLNDYLESKRGLFPRFFFLSNEELLEILSETKEPKRVQPHLKKCFEGINSLKFDEEKKIHGMYSIEGEYVPFTRIIDPIASKGAVEDWLVQVEDVMVKSVKQTIDQCNQDYAKKPREKWVLCWAGQAILGVGMMHWTSGAEDAMKKNGINGLQKYYEDLQSQLIDTVGVVRSDISNLQRGTMEALIVLDVHAKDVIKQELVDKEICDPKNFAWLSQLRFYWEAKDGVEDVWVKIINCVCDYCYEYLGNSARLVITPLTDRCYRTLCGAVYLTYGGAPEGPAGTGKTETTKDLAKSLARQCVVFNCSDAIDYIFTGKFFKGNASCGCWICFDEFNRIRLEVLSVIAQQVQTIQQAIKKKQERFVFEGTELPIKHTCNVFITMNPGYAGRAELPDNLKALFRTVAMMVPDYTMIAEISLYSFGFSDAKPLSLKITTTYTLCSEQLSSQKHYDYGMRAVKSVLTAAGNLKKRYKDENESILILRAINDVNLAKFLAHDLPLFKNITSDLFPGIILPEPDYNHLMRCMKEQMDKMNLQHHEYFILKIIQLYEMILVRHGLMIVGLPFSGKTSCLKVLAAALTQLNSEGLMGECKTYISTLNPKSVTNSQLYGNFDEVSHDWSDGVLAVEYRTMARGMSIEDRRWLHFDGPVDAIWIENMNTVLDDNKKLCLMSGEVIQMTANMNMIFEPMDLAIASPATVSRCGMVYLQPHEMGWKNLYLSWKNKLPKTFEEDQHKIIDTLINTLVDPILAYIRSDCVEESPTEDQNLVVSCLRILRSLLVVFDDENFYEQYRHDKKTIQQIIESSFVFSAIWSLCVSIRTEYRKPMTIQFKKICNGEIDNVPKLKNKILPAAFDRGTIYDWCYRPETNVWENWMDQCNKDELDQFPKNSVASDLIVTTVDTIRYGFLQELFIMNNIQSLFVGPTGTGKTAYIQNILFNKLAQDKWLIIEVGFSAQTHCNQVQDIIDMKLDKRRKDHFGPRFGMRCVVFIDDLNMPKVILRSQPPIEILRQLLDQGGWYDRKDNKHPFRNIVDTMLVTAMGTPGGGRSFITPRFQRHFNIIAFANFDDNTLKSIFTMILKWHFRVGNFSSEVSNMINNIVMASLKIYTNIQADLKPTPLKSHYTFNLRDISKVICGMTMPTKKELTTMDQCLRLWAHETTRIFGDRLVDNKDRMWMLEAVKSCTKAPFGSSFDTVFKHLDTDKNGKVETLDEFRGLAFADIYTTFGMPERPYEEILDRAKLQQCADDHLSQYNMMSDKPMPLVLFNFAIEHLMRVGRVLKQPGGHCLLVGVGGSGRQSLSRLASKIADFDVFQVEIKKQYRTQEWREDIKMLMKQIGGKGNSTSFLFTDTQIKQESFLEDVNNILNTGEVPNIFAVDEKADVIELVRAAAKDEERCPNGTPQELFAYFLERCKKFLHIILCFSPIGASLRNRIRDFPSIVNCTTIDWFSEWPPDALQAVAQKFLIEVEMPDDVRDNCAKMVQVFHSTTQTSANKFQNELKRVYYVTPTSYLELINTFKTLLKMKREEVMALKNRYANGYDCLIDTENKVNVMKQELIDLQPILIQTGKETAEKLVVVTAETEAADKIKKSVAAEEQDAQAIADKANAIKTDCETQLAGALPALKAAEDAVNCIQKGDIAILKGLAKPPGDVVMVTSVVCMFFNIKPEKIKDEANPGKKIDNWWPPSQKMLQDVQMIPKLINYDKEGITQELIDKIQPIITQENFQVNKLKSVSQVAMNLAKWVFAMDGFYKVNLVVKPKKAQLAIAEKEYAEVMAVLKVKQDELKVIVDKVNALQFDLKQTQDKKESLEAQVADCQAKLVRAESLIEGLGGEKTRWKAKSEELAQTYVNLTGDVLISSGMIAYLGAFTSVYRDDLAAQWVKGCEECQIPNGGKFSLERVLGDPVQIRNWSLFGLPNDSFSVENAIINDKTRRWPLFIDPQAQANKWVRSMGKELQIKIVKFSDNNYLKLLEAGIRMGQPVMIENVGEDLDPAIEPLLQKQIVTKGTSMTIKMGDSIIEYDPQFKFYLTTKLRNPHYLPEVSTKVTLINFMITFEGLSDQLLGIVVEKEQPDLQTKKEALVVEGAKNKNKLSEIEDQILQTLQNSADILGDAKGIEILQNAKIVSDDINKKQAIAEKTEIEIDEARTGYKPVAKRTSGLFFCISDLANIDPMYQYSLDFFKTLFVQAILSSEQSDDFDERLGFLNDEFLQSLYRNICRSLFSKDKLVFSTMLAMKLMELNGELDPAEVKFFLTGGVSLGEALPDNPAPWISDKCWGEMNRLDKLPKFKGWIEHFTKDFELYKVMYDSSTPQDFELPEPWLSQLDKLQYMCIQRCIRPDLILPAMANFVISRIGEYFVVPPPFDLGLIFKDSTPQAPLIFVLSPGADPLNALEKYAESRKRAVSKVSLGQGQGPIAEKMIEEGIKEGNWVVLQNCHLATSWMDNLEKICEDLPKRKPHRDFRLWLTSYPSPDFPVTVLQNGVKMTNEPPKGLKPNLLMSYATDPISNKEWFESCTNPKVFRKMLFGLCFFHAYIQERKLFGPLGWVIKYQFNESDLRISALQLKLFIDEYPEAVPLDALNYLAGECNYGGRVTDDKDRRLMSHVLKLFYCEQIYADDDYKFSPSGKYYAPKHADYEEYIAYINSLPNFQEPEAYGFHENAAITKDQNETNDALMTILICQSSAGGGGGSEDQDAITNKLCDSLLAELPGTFDLAAAERKYPISYNQSMNTVLTQELDRFNGLIKVIVSSLKNLKKAIKGEVLLSTELEEALNSLQNGMVPAMWLAVSFPSLKSLGGYMKDLITRLEWFSTWVEDGLPKILWISRFFFTQGFLTGTKQNYARKYGIAIDLLNYEFEVINNEENVTQPEDGVNVVGMYIEGAKWNNVINSLDESDPKVLFTRCPMMLFIPCKTTDFKQYQCYECPIYKTSERKGVLMTTGHSTNFVILMRMPCKQDPTHWIIRGTAIIMSLDD